MKHIPDELGGRRIWTFALLVIFTGVGLVVLSEVFWTLFLASNIA